MQVIWQDDVFSRQPVGGFPPPFGEDFVSNRIGEDRFAIFRADGQENDGCAVAFIQGLVVCGLTPSR